MESGSQSAFQPDPHQILEARALLHPNPRQIFVESESEYHVPNNVQSLRNAILFSPFNLLLLASPPAIAAYVLRWEAAAIFGLNFLPIVPLTGLVALITQELCLRCGVVIGSLLSATLGNAVQLILGLLILKGGLIRVVQAFLVGSILSNLLLVRRVVGSFDWDGMATSPAIHKTSLTNPYLSTSTNHTNSHRPWAVVSSSAASSITNNPSTSEVRHTFLPFLNLYVQSNKSKPSRSQPKVARTSTSLLFFTILLLLIPAAFEATVPLDDRSRLEVILQLSRGISVALLVLFALYTVFQLWTHANLHVHTHLLHNPGRPRPYGPVPEHGDEFVDADHLGDRSGAGPGRLDLEQADATPVPELRGHRAIR
ncbi:hypothetical protein BC938DRAFT_471998 [Jimgerdemannia flammicorona]|uniref:Sodium/calcium exchanger membrane region domain-containing protein n=1 Tax=Jimgerdemannia flammicorona TaxID=994334 RepID=A0A433Q710_9FUNG|nr:hypothetical protein BC938DRAFT_471998 [Jimgerdemannia flammicorona]